jgi:hypothetical protein
MKSNAIVAKEAPFHINSLMQLWWTLEASHFLKAFIFKIFKLVEIVMVQVLGSAEDEQTFSTLSFMKSKLKIHFNEHLHTIVGMYSQTFYTLNTFVRYNACYDDLEGAKT